MERTNRQQLRGKMRNTSSQAHKVTNTGISAYGDGNENLVYNKKICLSNRHLIN